MITRRRAREVVLQILFEEDLHPLRDYDLADEFLAKRLHHSGSPVSFAKELLHGVRAHRAELDSRIERHSSNWSLKRMATIDRNVLRMAAYEMLYANVPGRVAINEAIEIARRYGNHNSGQFVNGILDRVLKDHIASSAQADDTASSTAGA